jgi:hypothetical protein
LCKCIEEIPEGSTVSDGMINGTADKNTIGKFSYLNGHYWRIMAAVTDFPIKSKKFFERLIDIYG